MQRFSKRLCAAAVCTTGLMALNHVHAQAAKQGEEQVTHTFTFTDRTMKLGDRTVIQRELTGLSHNDKGSGMFHDLGMRCMGFIDVVGGKASSIGRCVEVDADGDQIFSTFENKGGAGAHLLIGGTGKYTGISGRQDFSGVRIVKAPEGASVMVIPLKVKWTLP